MTTADLAEAAMKDALTHLFAEDRTIDTVISDNSSELKEAKSEAVHSESTKSDLSQPGTDAALEDALSAEERAASDDETVVEGTAVELPAPIEQPAEEQTKPKVSRAELIQIMEGFVELVKNSDENDLNSNPLSFAPPKVEVKDQVTVTDRTAEINELRTLLVEAQGTIIRLLTDRVDDRARLAQLQSEIRLLPDMKSQSERAAAVALTAEEFRAEFSKVKLEIERMKLTKMRGEIEPKSRPWWLRFTDWLKKKDTVGE